MTTLKLLRDMIAIPSVNPMRANSGESVERGMANFIEAVLHREHIDCERQTVAEGRDNIIGIVHSNTKNGDRDGLMFNSHMDTVPVANMSINPFDPVIKNQLVFGRGSCDAKASLAAMITAVVNYSNQAERPTNVVFAAMADEEFSFSGSWKLIEKEWPVSACVVGEPTKLARVIAHKGVVRWQVRVAGVSAHGATPERGQNAIYDAARLALALEEYGKQLRTSARHSLLGTGTINVGRVQGGQSVNMVPDSCLFEIERRLIPREDASRVLADCEKFVRGKVGENVEFSFVEPYLIDPPLDTAADAAVVERLGMAQQAELGYQGDIEGANYCTDASKLVQVGIETVVCGPGDVSQAHTATEFVQIEQVEQAARLYEHLLTNWIC